MKKILFCCYGLGTGGIETCLVNLLNTMPKDKYDIDVLLMNPEYDSLNRVHDGVNLIDSFKFVMNTTDTLSEIKSHGGIIKNPTVTIRYCIFRILVKINFYPWRIFKPINKDYDIAIAYSQNDYSPYYIIDKIKAEKKVMWYHNGSYDFGRRKYKRDKKYYSSFDYFVAVSDDCKNMLLEKFSFKPGRLITLKNICRKEEIEEKAEAFCPNSYKKSEFDIATVGRLTREKGAVLAIDTCKILQKKGLNFCWHWIGDGNQRNEVTDMINRHNLQDCFILEGNQTNPYPYIKYADIYVQSSYYEAYSTTVTEAKLLKKPIVTTDVGGMREQLQNHVNGIIVGISADELANAIEFLMHNQYVMKSFSDILESEDFSQDKTLREYEKTVFA